MSKNDYSLIKTVWYLGYLHSCC